MSAHQELQGHKDRMRVQQLEAALRKIRALPTYSVSQGIVIDMMPDRLLKTHQVYPIIDAALGAAATSQADGGGEHG